MSNPAPSIRSGPHDFRRLSRWFHRDKCVHCYLPADLHPVNGWTVARPMGDTSPTRLFEVHQRG